MKHYPDIGDANFKGALWTFKQQLALEIRVRYGISMVLLQTSFGIDLCGL